MQGATKPGKRNTVFAVFAEECGPVHLLAETPGAVEYPRQGSNL